MVEEKTIYLSLNFKTGITHFENIKAFFLDRCRALEEPR